MHSHCYLCFFTNAASCHYLSFYNLKQSTQPPLPKAPGFLSRYPLFPSLCHVSLQLHGECGFPLKFPCCLALYWLSPIVVYHQQIWQDHSWFLHCSHCWLETKRGLIEPSPSSLPAPTAQFLSIPFGAMGSHPQFVFLIGFGYFIPKMRGGKKYPFSTL